jgi:hypothetical protein
MGPSRWKALRTGTSAALALVALASSVIFGATGAHGDPYADGYPDSGFKPDSDTHVYCFSPEFDAQALQDAADYAFANLVNETTMHKNKVSPCYSTVDAVWHVQNLTGLDGQYVCVDFESANRCQRASLTIDPGAMGGPDDRRQTSCHETGHSVGLTHAGDCMGTDSNEQRYHGHHEDHVNHDR